MISYYARARWLPYVWIAPVLLLLCFVLIVPWIWSFYVSLHHYVLTDIDSFRFVGLKNYIDVVTSADFQMALKNSLVLLVVVVAGQFVCGFGVALLLDALATRIKKSSQVRDVLLTGFLIPMMVSPVISGVMWEMMLHTDFGIINYLLNTLFSFKVHWLSDPDTAKLSIYMVEIWRGAPFVTLVLFAGLQSVPLELVDAAKVDGANRFQTYQRVIVPWITPLIGIALLFRTMYTFRVFDTVFALFQGGGPANAGMVLGVYLYQKWKFTWNLGQTSAISFIILFITVLLSLSYLKLLKGRQ